MAEGFTCRVEQQEYRYAYEDLHQARVSSSYSEKEDPRLACKDLPEYQGSGYCVLHFDGEKKEDFKKVMESKLADKNYDFRGTIFPEGTSDFKGREFDAAANFSGATFVGADFSRARFSGEATDFGGTQFSGEMTYFEETQFSGEVTDFSRARFSGDATDFSGAQFSGEATYFLSTQFSSGGLTYFSEAEFSGERTSFSEAEFNSEVTDFSRAQFNSSEVTSFTEAEFSGEATDFSGVQFSGKATYFLSIQFNGKETSFSGAQFIGKETSFSGAQFIGKETSFSEAAFGSAETYFEDATFTQGVAFSGATFREKASFWGSKVNLVFGSEAWARFNRCRIEKPEQFTFNTVLLHPGWFINTDVRKVDFTDVKWYGMPGGIPEGTLDDEIQTLEARGVESPHTLLAQACRRLSANAEENREYPLANEFHYWSMDALRKEGWSRLGLIGYLYWVLSGYGERPRRAFLVLVGMGTLFAILYVMMAGSIEHVGQAFLYSLAAMVRLTGVPAMAPLTKLLQPSEPGLFQLLVTAEGILGPLQIALLALAVRRRVMR